MCDVNFKKDLGCDKDLSVYRELIRQKGGKVDSRVNVDYKGSSSHSAMMIPLTFFKEDTRKLLVQTVSTTFA